MKLFFYLILVVFPLISQAQSDKIKVYFNNSVNNSTSSLVDAINVNDFTDTIAAYINRTQTTLDVCNYNTGDITIVNAINAAKNRGVVVRYIAAATALGNNDELANLSSAIPLIQRPDDGEVMHNKFIIYDVDDVNNATILSGSANHSKKSLSVDYNNIIFIQDQPLAQAYKIEFEEMWGSNTNTPDPNNAKFGNQKTDNTPHSFTVDGIAIELYFSPSDNTESKIVDAIMTADSDINFAMLTFTSNAIGDAIVNRQNNGIIARGQINNTSYFGSEYNALLDAGVDVISTQSNLAQLTHHKYVIIDADDTSSDPILITGSHNWSNSAESDYDENVLIIHDKYIAHHYLEEFLARRPIAPTSIVENKQILAIKTFPNPVVSELSVQANQAIESIEIIDLTGKKLLQKERINNASTTIAVSSLSKGVYVLIVKTNNAVSNQLITIQ